MTNSISRYFNPQGILKEIYPDFEYRPEQHTMAEAVMKSLNEAKPLIVEAGTGVGKSMAYLIPLCIYILEAKIGRAVVSTYTKALQRQLVEKDLPLLKERLFPEITFHLCMGSENYLCKRRLRIALDTGNVDIFEEEDLQRLLKWKEISESGLLLELSPPLSLWRKVCRESDLCHGRACNFYGECFYQHAKKMERESRILVTNHHLLFTHIASGWNVLPEFETIIFDEAHEIEDVASDYLGIEVSNTMIKYILDNILSQKGKGYLVRMKDIDTSTFEEIRETIEHLRITNERFFNLISGSLNGEKAKPLITQEQYISLKDNFVDHLRKLKESLYRLSKKSPDTEEGKDLRILADRCISIGESIDIIIEQTLDEHVYWIAQEGRKIKAVATPIEMSHILNAQLFQIIDRTVLTSATLTVEGSFDYTKKRLGIQEAYTLCLESPFKFEKQVSLYIPETIPDPQEDGYIEVLSAEINRILEYTGGKTLILFTSYSLLDNISERINKMKLKVLKQGDKDSYSLIEDFKRDSSSVLLGTYTFWQGIDVPGDALQCVIITKLPFSVPTDPVVQARMESLLKKGLDPFYLYQVPNAVIRFRQGFGRLIRTSRDRGLVAVLDSRLLKKRYGQVFLRSLPKVQIFNKLSEIVSVRQSTS